MSYIVVQGKLNRNNTIVLGLLVEILLKELVFTNIYDIIQHRYGFDRFFRWIDSKWTYQPSISHACVDDVW